MSNPAKPMQFIPVRERFRLKTKPGQNGCIVWVGKIGRDGYGQCMIARRYMLAHRAVYEEYVGPIPIGLTLDHLCGNRSCVNPDHLEPVTRAENVKRAFAKKTHCFNGHERTEKNTFINSSGHRICRVCNRIAAAKSRAKRKAAE